MPLSAAVIAELQPLFSADALSTDAVECLVYGYDNSRRQVTPDAVVFPTTHAQVVALVRACRAHRIALTARGAVPTRPAPACRSKAASSPVSSA